MGKLARAFGLGEKGKIGMSVDKPAYIAGEVVHGTIYVEVYEPIQCDGAFCVSHHACMCVALWCQSCCCVYSARTQGDGEGARRVARGA